MDEVRRFLRYILPGMASLGQLLLAIHISDSSAISSFVTGLGAKADIINVVAAAFISSGAIGFVLASIYHAVYWKFPFLCRDHKFLVDELISDNKLELTDIHGKAIKEPKLSERDAWTIVTYYSYAKIHTPHRSRPKAGLSKMTDRLTDFTHAHGTTFIGTLVGSVVWFFAFSDLPCCTLILLLAYWGLLLVIYGYGHYLADRALGLMANAAIFSHITASVNRRGSPVVIPFLRKPKR